MGKGDLLMKLIKYFREQKQIIDFIATFLCVTIVYRFIFLVSNEQTTFEPFNFLITIHALGFVSDLIACTILIPPLLITRYILHKLSGAYSAFFCESLFIITFVCISLIYLINQKIFSALFIGLNSTLLSAYFHQGFSALTLYSVFTVTDLALLFSMLFIYLIVRCLPIHITRKMIAYCLLPFYFLSALWGASVFLSSRINPSNRFIAIYSNPISQMTYTFLKSFNAYNNAHLKINAKQTHSISLVDPSFLAENQVREMPTLRKLNVKPLNVVIFVLESVGTSYIFNDINGKIPMPFLKWLSTQGIWFNNHYSAGNISALGQFSLFTGIYPNPTPTHFEMQNELQLPTIATWLGKQYDSFLVSASNNLYFSMGINKTFTEYDNAITIKPDGENLFFDMFLDETDGFNFFSHRLSQAKKPFLAVYWSGAAHFPYKDYSAIAKIIKPANAYSRYINGLVLLDQEIKKTYRLLKKQHWLENTIFIIAGDHGESFPEQHDMYCHGKSLFDAEIKTPLLIYAPKQLKPRLVNNVTSTVDLLPTLLDILHIRHEKQLQGESVFKRAYSREFIFTYGDEDELAAIDHNNLKMILSFSNATCSRYDLNRDPKERHPLACVKNKQQEAILKFRAYQPELLAWYNGSSSLDQLH